ncbi:hypothetical protein GCM10028791_43000 [Echinicola sediminis]
MTKHKFPSAKQLRWAINRFKNHDLKNCSIDDLIVEFGKLTAHFGFLTFVVPKTIKVHRIRINDGDKLFYSLNDLWCPPKHLITRLGRCNDIGDQMLYVSGGGHTCLSETNPKIGDTVTCVEFEVAEKFNVVEIGVLQNIKREKYFQQYAALNNYGTHYFYNGNDNLIKLDKTLKEFIIKEFTKTVLPEEGFLYKKSIAITKHFLGAPEIKGIMYPSTKMDLKDLNYAIPAEFAKDLLIPKRIDVFKKNSHY